MFKPGDKVVCVIPTPETWGTLGSLAKGGIYEIVKVLDNDTVKIKAIYGTPHTGVENALYAITRFEHVYRKVEVKVEVLY